MIARDDDADRCARAGDDQRRRADQLPAGFDRVVLRANLAARRHALGEPVGGRADVAARQRRRLDRDDGLRGRLRARRTHDAIDLDQADALLRNLRRDHRADGLDVGRQEPVGVDRARDAGAVAEHEPLPLLAIVAGNLVRRLQDLFDRRAEPVRRGAPDQLAPDDEHQHRRDDGHREQRRNELRPEAGERQRPAPLDDQLDDVPREVEDEHADEREIHEDEGVQHDLAEEIGIQLRGLLTGEDDERHERPDEQRERRDDQPRVVAERPASGRSVRRRRPGGGSRERHRSSFALSRSFSSVMNSPMSRKWR